MRAWADANAQATGGSAQRTANKFCSGGECEYVEGMVSRFDSTGLTRSLMAVAILSGCATPHSPPSKGTFQGLPDPTRPQQVPAEANTAPGQSQAVYPEAPANAQEKPFVLEPAEAAKPSAPLDGNGGAVELSDADLAEASKLVLGDLLGLPYTIDARAQGRVTLSTNGELTRDQLLHAFESALSLNNCALVEQQGRYIVTPIDNAQGQGLPVRTAGQAGYGISVFPLRGLNVDEVRGLLDGVASRPNLLRSAPRLNLLLAVGSSAERQSVAAAIEALQDSGLGAEAMAIYPVQFAAPRDIVRELRIALNISEDPAAINGNGNIRITPLERLNSILVAAPSRASLTKIEALIEKLDRTSGASLSLRAYPVVNIAARDAVHLLGGLLGQSRGQDSTGPVAPDLAQTTASTGLAAQPNGNSGGPSRVADLAPFASDQGGPNGPVSVGSVDGAPLARIVADGSNNSLLVMARADGHTFVSRALAAIDTLPDQVLIDVTIAEVTLSDDLRFGVQYFFDTKGPAGEGGNTSTGGLTLGSSLIPQAFFPGFNFLLANQDTARIVIDALDAITNVQIVSSPSIAVLDNQSATLQVGDQVPVVTRQAQGTENGTAPLVSNIDFRDTGVILRVAPRIGANGLVTMTVEQEVSSVVRVAGQAASLTPTISQRRFSSSVAVQSGHTIVLGGLIDDSQQSGRAGFPGLTRIPILGGLFGRTERNARRTELLVFLSPRVITSPQAAALAAQDLTSRMGALSAALRKAGSLSLPSEVDPPPIDPDRLAAGNQQPIALAPR